MKPVYFKLDEVIRGGAPQCPKCLLVLAVPSELADQFRQKSNYA